MKKSIWPRVLFIIGIILLVCYIGGMVYIRYDYFADPLNAYGSAPATLYYMLHSVFFLIPSLVCFLIACLLYRKNK